MAAITNAAGESVELSFGGKGLVVTFTSKRGKAVSRTFEWRFVSHFMARLIDEFKADIADWADEQTKESA